MKIKVSRILRTLFQRDYWSWTDTNLANEATKHNIPHISMGGEHGEHWYMDRRKIIDQLLTRDNALRTKETTIISIIALLVSICSLLFSFFKN
jgi:hypothetical protein